MLSIARRVLVLSLSAFPLTGCLNLGIGEVDYGCPGIASGVSCISARDVYEATNSRDRLTTSPVNESASPSDQQGQREVPPTVKAQGIQSGFREAAFRPVVPVMPENPVPYRRPAVVMRIWIAPWEDDIGDLHMPGTIFTEVEGRRWQVGLENAGVETVATPLEPATLLKTAQ